VLLILAIFMLVTLLTIAIQKKRHTRPNMHAARGPLATF
jgi:hypothetical protein